jgi:hypothetical protein
LQSELHAAFTSVKFLGQARFWLLVWTLLGLFEEHAGGVTQPLYQTFAPHAAGVAARWRWTILKDMLAPQAAGMIHTDLDSFRPLLLLLLLLLPPLVFSSYVRCCTTLKGTLAPQAAGCVLT